MLERKTRWLSFALPNGESNAERYSTHLSTLAHSVVIPNWATRAFSAPLFPMGQQSISLFWLLQVAMLLVSVSLLSRAVKFLLKERVLRWFRFSEGRREAIATLSTLGLAALGYVLVVQGMGLDLGAITVVVGALGVGLGFGLQDLTRNLSSGLTLLMEGKLKVGDLIEFNQTTGYIKEISIRSTVIRTFKGSEIIVPNTLLANGLVQNLSYSNTDGRVDVTVVVAHGSDVLEVTEVLLQAALSESNVSFDPPPLVTFTSLGEAGLCFELGVWTSEIFNGQTIRSGINYAIEQGLRERGIQLARQRREIELVRPGSQALRIGTGSTDRKRAEAPERVPLSELLPRLPHLGELRGRTLRELIGSGARRSLRHGDVLVRQGEHGQSFNLVISGCIDAIHETENISKKVFSFRQGEFFGELPLLLDVPYPTTMRAAEESTLFVIPLGGFKALLKRHPSFADIIAEEVGRRRDVLNSYEAELRERGLLIDKDMSNPLLWIREQLQLLLRA